MKERFIVDGMLGSLARKLRIFGYDTVYDVTFGDEEILETARSEGRIVLTSDRNLVHRAAKIKVTSVLLAEESDEDRLAAVFRKIQTEIRRLDPKEARCAVCNGEVGRVRKDEVSDAVPEGVLESQAEFYRCGSCGKIYWIGSHWKRLYDLSEKISRRFQQA